MLNITPDFKEVLFARNRTIYHFDIESSKITKKEQKEIRDEIIKGIKTHKILLPIFIGFDLSFDECSNNKKFHDWDYDWELGKR